MVWKYRDEVSRRLAEEAECRNNMKDWIYAGQEVSEWLLPTRGVYNVQSRPSRRDFVPRRVVNPYAKHAFGVMTAGLKEGIAPATRPWFDAAFRGAEAEASDELSYWMEGAKKVFYTNLTRSNFYNQAHNYIKEISGFGNGSWGVFSGKKVSPYTFHVMTFGEWTIGTNSAGVVDRLYRTIFMNIHQLIDKFGDNVPQNIQDMVENGDSKLDFWYTVIEGVVPEKYLDMPFTRFWILLGDEKRSSKGGGGVFGKSPADNKYKEFLKAEGVNEFPYPTTRWDISGSDEYGVGPGIEAIPPIKRLQEVVKAGMVSYHLSIRPPLNVPVHLRGQVRNAPNAHNYYTDPEHIIRPSMDTRFDHASADRSEGVFVQALQEIFYNDVFLTASRDANASPLKARQVDEIASDRVIRIGPQLGRLFFEGFAPALARAFAISMREGHFEPLPEQFQGKKMELELTFTSVLAQALKAAGAMPIQRYLQTIGGVAQFDETVIDIIDTDAIAYELADIEGVPATLIRPQAAVEEKRKQRAAAVAKQQQEEQAAKNQAMDQGAAEVEGSRADTMKTLSEAGSNLSETMTDGYSI